MFIVDRVFKGTAQITIADPHRLAPAAEGNPGSVQIVVGTLANADAECDARDTVTFCKHRADALAEQFRRAVRVDWRRLHRRRLCATAEATADDDKVRAGKDHAPGTVLLGCGHDVQQQIGVARLDPRPAGARARIRCNMQRRIDTGKLGRPVLIEGAQSLT